MNEILALAELFQNALHWFRFVDIFICEFGVVDIDEETHPNRKCSLGLYGIDRGYEVGHAVAHVSKRNKLCALRRSNCKLAKSLKALDRFVEVNAAEVPSRECLVGNRFCTYHEQFMVLEREPSLQE